VVARAKKGMEGSPQVGREDGTRGTREAAKQETRERLLQAASRRFVQDGFLDASTASIAREAGVAHGTIFLHFPDRDALLLAVVERLLYQLSSTLHPACFRANDLEALCRLFMEALSTQEEIYGALVRDLPRFPLPLKRQVFTTFSAITAHFTEVLEQGQAEGTLRPIPTAVANSFFFGALNHLFLYRDLMTPDGRVVATHGETLVNTFVQMLAMPEPHHQGAGAER